MKVKFKVTGMTCSACVAHVEKAVNAVDGVTECSVNLLTGQMTVDCSCDNQTIIAAVQKAGYKAKVWDESCEKPQPDKKLYGLITSLVLLVILMYISMGHMLGLPEIPFLKGTKNAVRFAVAQLIITLPVLIINRKYFITGYKRLFTLSPNMDSLIAVSATASLTYGLVATVIMAVGLRNGDFATVDAYRHQLYFESAAMILAFVSLGKYFEEKSKKKTTAAISKLVNLAPDVASVITADGEKIIAASELKIGDTVLVRSGEKISADGIVVEGETYVDESLITGESVPVKKSVGDKVVGGALNKNGAIKICVQKVGKDTALGKIITFVEEASSSKAPIAKLADKVAGVFVPIVMCISLITFIIWLACGGGFELAFNMGVSVLVISCPCALGLATPAAIMVATGKGAENGILIKSGDALETLRSVDTVVFDKTGTITVGKPTVVDAYFANDGGYAQIAAAIENLSEHPLAEAIANYSENNSLKVQNFTSYSGKGVSGTVDGKTYYIGSKNFIKTYSTDIADYEVRSTEYANQGKTPVFMSDGEKIVAVFAVADSIKPDAANAIKQLKSMGKKIVMLTGDNKATAKAVAELVGIDQTIAEVLPEEKASVIKNLTAEGKVAFVGDGINDAPALTVADVGIAIGAGTDIAIESADVVLMKNGLTEIPTAISLSNAAMRTVKQNLFWAFFYNALGIPLAAGVLYIPFGIRLNPMIGSLCMSLSSIFVVSNALRLKLFKPKGEYEMKKQVEVKIEGMMCNHCAARVETALNVFDGVSVKINLKKKAAYLSGAESVTDEQITSAITAAGYTVVEIKR